MGIGCASKMADSSPAKMKSEQQLGDVSSILQKLKDEVAYLQDEVEAKGAGFYVPLANQLNATRAAMEELTCTLDSCNGGLRSKDAGQPRHEETQDALRQDRWTRQGADFQGVDNQRPSSQGAQDARRRGRQEAQGVPQVQTCRRSQEMLHRNHRQ